MKTSKTTKRLYLDPWRIVLIFLGVFLLLVLTFYLTFQAQKLWPPETSFYIYTPLTGIVMIVLIILIFYGNYYLLEKDRIVHHRMNKVAVYRFEDIIYIDEKWSVKHKMLHFYDKDGREHYLAFDRKGFIYLKAKEKARLLTLEAFKERFPNVRI